MKDEKVVARLVLRDAGELSDRDAYRLVNWLRDQVLAVLFKRSEFSKVYTARYIKT